MSTSALHFIRVTFCGPMTILEVLRLTNDFCALFSNLVPLSFRNPLFLEPVLPLVRMKAQKHSLCQRTNFITSHVISMKTYEVVRRSVWKRHVSELDLARFII